MSPFFSILVPTYNQSQYLGEALDSLIAQTDPDWEAIIVNDGSTDNTTDIIEAYCQKDSRFQAIHKPNGGTGSALNVGLNNAQGKWICWLSSDDVFEVNKLEIHHQWIKKYPETKFFFSDFRQLVETTGKITNYNPNLRKEIPLIEYQIIQLLERNYVAGNSICIDKLAWYSVGCFNEELRYAQDYDMWLRLMMSYPALFIPEYTYLQRVYPEQESQVFSDFCLYDSAKATIQILNTYNFKNFFPLVDLKNKKSILNLANVILKIALNPNSFIYQFGFHPILILKTKIFFDSHFKNQTKFNLLLLKNLKKNASLFKGTHRGFWCDFCLFFFSKQQLITHTHDDELIANLSFNNLGITYYLWLSYIELESQNYSIKVSLFAYLQRFCDCDVNSLLISEKSYKLILANILKFQSKKYQNIYLDFVKLQKLDFLYCSFTEKLLLLEKIDISLEYIYTKSITKYGYFKAIPIISTVYFRRLTRFLMQGIFLYRLNEYIKYIKKIAFKKNKKKK